jgi:hypothetical protein
MFEIILLVGSAVVITILLVLNLWASNKSIHNGRTRSTNRGSGSGVDFGSFDSGSSKDCKTGIVGGAYGSGGICGAGGVDTHGTVD